MKTKKRPLYYDDEQNQVMYPWKKWFRMRSVTLVHGTDFDCLVHSMAQQVRNAARKYGYRVHMVVNQHSISFSPENLGRKEGKRNGS